MKDFLEQLKIIQGNQISNMAADAFGVTDRSGRTFIAETRAEMISRLIVKAAKVAGINKSELNKLKKKYLVA